MKDSGTPHHGARLDAAGRCAGSCTAPVLGHIAVADVLKIGNFLPLRLEGPTPRLSEGPNNLPDAGHGAGVLLSPAPRGELETAGGAAALSCPAAAVQTAR